MTTIPTDPTKFKQWADAACVDWPGELQMQAYRAWRAMEGKVGYTEQPHYEMFLEAHSRHLRR